LKKENLQNQKSVTFQVLDVQLVMKLVVPKSGLNVASAKPGGMKLVRPTKDVAFLCAIFVEIFNK